MRSVLPRLLGLLILALLCRCSLSLQNPEDEAKAKIEKKVPTSLAVLTGRWIADSAYTIDDVKATHFSEDDLRLEIFPDSSLHAADTVRQIFSPNFGARFSLNEDTLILHPTEAGRAPDTFQVLVRFAGNWLRLYRASDYRFLHFHHSKGPDSAVRDSVLPEGLWSLQGRRAAVDSFAPMELHRDFTYLRLPADSLYRDQRVNGISEVTPGTLHRDGVAWTWTTPAGERRFRADLIAADSLRLWPLRDTVPDSGFFLYVKVPHINRFDLDVTPILGYWRSDTVKTPRRDRATHFGRFYDLELKGDHTVRNLSNMTTLPRFDAWSVDSGSLFMDGPAGRGRFAFKLAAPDSLILTADSGGAFDSRTIFSQTRIDGSRLADHPLERFDAGYMHVTVGADTLKYYFNVNYLSPERFEAAQNDSSAPPWAALRLTPGVETSQSGQADFFFAFDGRSDALGKYTCRSRPTLDLAIRLTAASTSAIADGLIEGSCRIVSAEKPPSDSTLAVGGFFRLRRRNVDQLRAPLWSLP